MAIIVQDITSGAGRGTAGTSLPTWNHTVSPGSNRKLVVDVATRNTGGVAVAVASITYGGVALTKAHSEVANNSTNYSDAETWFLDAPAVGTAAILVTFAASVTSAKALSQTLVGAKPGAPERIGSATTGTGATSFAGSITPLSNGAHARAFLVTANSNLAATAASGQTVEQTAAGATVQQLTTANAPGGSPPSSVAFNWSFPSAFGHAAQVLTVWEAAVEADSVDGGPANGQVSQRSNSSIGEVLFAASFAGQTPASLEARIMSGATIVRDWTACSISIAGATISARLASVPVGDGYTMDIRTKTAGGVVIATKTGTNLFGVGKLYVFYGSSSPQKMFSDTTAISPNALGRAYRAGLWVTNTGAGAVPFGNAETASEPGVPVGLIDCGVGGTLLSAWASKSANYTAMVAAVVANGGKLEAAIQGVGGNDAGADGAVPSQAGHEVNLRMLISNLRADLNQAALPVFIIQTQRRTEAGSNAYDAQFTRVRSAELAVCEDSGVRLGSVTEDLSITDGTHPPPAGYETIGKRLARRVAAVLRGSAAASRGPRPSSASYNPITGYVTVNFDIGAGDSLVGRTGQTGLTGFRASVDGFATLMTISEAFVSGPATVALNVGTGLSGVVVDYLTGANPVVTNCVWNNGAAPS